MLSVEALQNMVVMFATPCSDHSVKANYSKSMFGLASAAIKNDLRCVNLIINGALIPYIRNTVVSMFLANKQYTHLFFIDSDISFESDQVFRLLLSDFDIAAGTYPRKAFYWPEGGITKNLTQQQFHELYTEFQYKLVEGAKVDKEGFIEVEEVPAGFLCIKRHALERMVNEYPELMYVMDGHPDQLHLDLFNSMIEPVTRRFLSEDYSFCHRWRRIGGRIHLDSTCNLGHLGQHLFKGNLASKLERK